MEIKPAGRHRKVLKHPCFDVLFVPDQELEVVEVLQITSEQVVLSFDGIYTK